MSELVIRRATPDDLDDVLALLRDAMHRSDDERFVELFRWKHIDNAFGASPAWVAVDHSSSDRPRIAAVRYLMRWEFERSGRVVRAVRAVDTATHPDYQGRGLFTKLTMGAIVDLESEGVDFIFNTPNDQSRPGYVKMGWSILGQVPVPSRPLSVQGTIKMARARVSAAHFSLDVDCAESAAGALADSAELDALLAMRPPTSQLQTRLSPSVLRWRYGGQLLTYRAVSTSDGIGIFRIRQRGGARELAIALALSRTGRGGERRLARSMLRAARGHADYAIAIGRRPMPTFVPVPKAGPTLAFRPLGSTPTTTIDDWALTLGDIELL